MVSLSIYYIIYTNYMELSGADMVCGSGEDKSDASGRVGNHLAVAIPPCSRHDSLRFTMLMTYMGRIVGEEVLLCGCGVGE